MATDNPDPNRQAEAFRTPQQVINNLTGETAPDFQIEPSSIDRKIPSPNIPFPALLYKKSSAGKTLSVKVTTQQEYDRATSQGWHVGHPVEDAAVVEASAEGLQPLSILDGDGEGVANDARDPRDKQGRRQPKTAAQAAAGDANVAGAEALDRARAANAAKNDAIIRGGPNVPVIFAIGELSEDDAKAAIMMASTQTALDEQEASEKAHGSRRRVLSAIIDRRAGLG